MGSSPMRDRCGRTDERGRAPYASRAFTPLFQPTASALALVYVAVVMETVEATVSISELTGSIW